MNTRDETTAYFNTVTDAEAAMSELQRLGIPEGDMQLHHASSATTTRAGEPTFIERLKDFFTGEAPRSDQDSYENGALLTIFTSDPRALGVLRQWHGYIQHDEPREQSLRLKEERLDVDKQRVQQGEVRVAKDAVTERQQVDVPVTHEEVYIERRSPGEGETVADESETTDERDIRIPVMREEVTVDKHDVVGEEVIIGKRQVQETQTVGADLRKERARIETSGDVSPSGDVEDTDRQ